MTDTAKLDLDRWRTIDRTAADMASATMPYHVARRLLILAALREWAWPDPALVSLLPKGREDKAKRASCSRCGGYHDPSMFHLDYVGHADVTLILGSIDPVWSWTPLAFAPSGEPQFERSSRGDAYGLWIELTVGADWLGEGGATRLGYGSCDDGQFDAEKVLIGDAIRNAAMRFGVAVSLWSKADQADSTGGRQSPSPPRPQQSRQTTTPAPQQQTAPTWGEVIAQHGNVDTDKARRALAATYRGILDDPDTGAHVLEVLGGRRPLFDFATMPMDDAKELVDAASAARAEARKAVAS